MDVRKKFFVEWPWNTLPRELVDAPSLEVFKSVAVALEDMVEWWPGQC